MKLRAERSGAEPQTASAPRRRSVHLRMDTLGKAFNSDDGFTVRTLSGIDARDHRFAVHKDGTRAALGFFTTDLCTCQTQPLAEESREGLACDRLERVFGAVNCKRELRVH